MTSQLVIFAAFALIIVILASILGAVERRERFSFVGGIALFIAAHTATVSPESVAALLAMIGILLAAASTVPLLRQSV